MPAADCDARRLVSPLALGASVPRAEAVTLPKSLALEDALRVPNDAVASAETDAVTVADVVADGETVGRPDAVATDTVAAGVRVALTLCDEETEEVAEPLSLVPTDAVATDVAEPRELTVAALDVVTSPDMEAGPEARADDVAEAQSDAISLELGVSVPMALAVPLPLPLRVTAEVTEACPVALVRGD